MHLKNLRVPYFRASFEAVALRRKERLEKCSALEIKGERETDRERERERNRMWVFIAQK